MDLEKKLKLIPLAKRLAHLLSSAEGANALTTMQKLKQEQVRQMSTKSSGSFDSDRIGIWRRSEQSSAYIRSEKFVDEWRCWADQTNLVSDKGKKNVLLIGESVARGYLYDPAISFASVIQEYLDENSQNSYNLIDLARIDINAFDIENLMQESSVLEPDTVVFYAGNNWLHFDELNQEDLQKIIINFEKEGFQYSREYFNDIIFPRVVKRVLSTLKKCFKKSSIIVVIPEFNLGDWRNEPQTELPVHFYDDFINTWEELKEKAEQYLEKSKWDELIYVAQQMENACDGLSFLPHFYLGCAFEGNRDFEKSRTHFSKAKDSVVGIQMPCTPRCPEAIKKSLKLQASKMRMKVLSVPQVLKDYLGGEVPGRKVFLDYCHHNLEGMHVVAKGIASKIIGKEISESLFDKQKDLYSTYLLAAIHSAHYGQGPELLRFLLNQALEIDSDSCRSLFSSYLCFQSSSTTRWLHKAFIELAEHKNVERYLYPRNPHEWDKFADQKLFAVIEELLGQNIYEKNALNSYSLDEIDLLRDEFYAKTFRMRRGFNLGENPLFKEIRNQSLNFTFFTQKEDRRLKVTARLARDFRYVKTGLELIINDNYLAKFNLTNNWQDFILDIPEKYLKSGENKLFIKCPFAFPEWDKLSKTYLRDLMAMKDPDVLVKYMDLYECKLERMEIPN